MSALIRQYDWAATPVGTLDNWPVSLRTLMRMMLSSRFPTLIFWGPALTTFYNDAFRPSLGNAGKHPNSLGQPGHVSWAESWSVIGPMIHDIMQGGEAVWFEDQKLPIYRDGAMGYAYWTYCFSPLTDDAGAINGVLVTCTETTNAVESLQRVAASEAFTRTLIDNSPVASLVFTGFDMVIASINASMLSMLGRDASVIGQPFMTALPELQHTPLMARLRGVLSSGETVYQPEERIELIRFGQPHTGYYDYIYTALKDPAGQPTGVIVTAIEVTDQVQARQRLIDSQQQLLSWFTDSPVGIALVEGPQFIYRMANPFYCSLVDRTYQQLIDRPMMETIPELAGQGFDQLLTQVMATGQPYIASEIAATLIRHQQTETLYIDLTYQPQYGADQQITGVLIIATDVTQQVRNRQAISVSKARLSSLVESAPFPIALYVGERMQIELANRSIMDVWGKGYDVIGKSYQDILPELANQPIFAQVEGVRQTGIAFHARHQQVDIVVDGRLQSFYFNYSFTPVLDEQGQVYGVMNTAAEVTDLVLAQQALTESEARYRSLAQELEQQVVIRTEELAATNEELMASNEEYAAINEEYAAINEELESANRLLQRSNDNLQQFAYVASHDLQEPLRKIQQFGNLLHTRFADPVGEEGTAYIDRMQSAASRMSTLIRDLLTYSRIDTYLDANQPVWLGEVMADVRTNLELSLTETEARLEVAELPTVLGDFSQLSQLFQNLISNALKFRQKERSGVPIVPFVRVQSQLVQADQLPADVRPARPAQVYYRIDVIDNGIGFDQKYVDRIFQVFQRLHGKGDYAGTGIGLAICQKVAANHGGVITATSQPGQGATFSVYLPA